MTSSPSRPPGDEPSAGLFELVFSEGDGAPQDNAAEMQRIEWALRPASIPEHLSAAEAEEVEELTRELNSLQPLVSAAPPWQRETGNKASEAATLASPVGELRPLVRRRNLRNSLWLTAAAALAGIAVLLLFSIRPLADFVWNSKPPTKPGVDTSAPPDELPNEVDRAHRWVKVEYSLTRQAAEFLGDGWLIASRSADLESSVSAAARADALDEMEREMDALQKGPNWGVDDAILIGQWRLKRGESGLAAVAFRTALKQQTERTDAWVGLALSVAARNRSADPAAIHSTELRRLLAAWIEIESGSPRQRDIQQESQLRTDLRSWVTTNDQSRRHGGP